MATKLISSLCKIVVVGEAGFLTGGLLSMAFGKERDVSINKACLDGLSSKVMEAHQKLSRLLDENSSEADNIALLMVPTVAFAIVAYCIFGLVDLSLSEFVVSCNRNITNATAATVAKLLEKTNNRNKQINDLNQRLDGLEKHFACQNDLLTPASPPTCP